MGGAAGAPPKNAARRADTERREMMARERARFAIARDAINLAKGVR
jgi:hypothetical protein